MKYSVFLFCLLMAACMNSKDAKKTFTSEKNEESGEMCFLSVIGETVKDSLVMHLKIDENKVTGIYNWLPAEKDSRKGEITGTKSGNSINGKYEFVQEGGKYTQPILIELRENSAKVITNPGKEEKMVVEIDKIECVEKM